MADFSDEKLDEARTRADPTADGLISSIYNGGDNGRVMGLLRALVRNDDAVPAEAPEALRSYFTNIELPADADKERIANGRALFDEYGPQICWLLARASLPTVYACERGAKVLLITGDLITKSGAERRILETTQFLLDVMNPHGFEPNGHALRTIQKVRLMHAAIRYQIPRLPQGTWDPQWGVPINQEDLANTLLSFSVVVLNGLDAFRLEYSKQVADDYIYLWNQVGRMLGIEEQWLVKDLQEGRDLLRSICGRNWEKGPAGSALMKALSGVSEELVPGTWFDSIFATSMRLCFEKSIVPHKSLIEILDVPSSRKDTMLRGFVKLVDNVTDTLHLNAMKRSMTRLGVMRYVGFEMMQRFLTLRRGGARPKFAIPQELMARFEPSAATRLRSKLHGGQSSGPIKPTEKAIEA